MKILNGSISFEMIVNLHQIIPMIDIEKRAIEDQID
jgi:hypothetical protein